MLKKGPINWKVSVKCVLVSGCWGSKVDGMVFDEGLSPLLIVRTLCKRLC